MALHDAPEEPELATGVASTSVGGGVVSPFAYMMQHEYPRDTVAPLIGFPSLSSTRPDTTAVFGGGASITSLIPVMSRVTLISCDAELPDHFS